MGGAKSWLREKESREILPGNRKSEQPHRINPEQENWCSVGMAVGTGVRCSLVDDDGFVRHPHLAGVAIFAGNGFMLSDQRKGCAAIVVKAGWLPRGFRMAIGTRSKAVL